MSAYFSKILIANRGEIALRILRACRELGIDTVAVHSTADEESMHVRLADEAVCIGPPSPRESYLNAQAILSAAVITKADAIHPGVGFLAENAKFAEMVVDHGKVFIGPEPAHIRMMGDKVTALETAERIGLPVLPGSKGLVESVEDAQARAERIGYPVLLKATAGGGGRGMKPVRSEADMASALSLCRSEAATAFGDDGVYLEKLLDHPRHIEIQLMGDGAGEVLHFWERDCSLQRRHQKVFEEAPSPALSQEQRERICTITASSIAKLNYLGAGTVEYLYQDGEFYFIEMNTRIQVEHPVTEMITGIDLIAEQIRLAAGAGFSRPQEAIECRGHAIEVRVTAERPDDFTPSPGRVELYHPPGGPGVRIDSGLFEGAQVPPFYDSMIAKLIVSGTDRAQALARLQRALSEYDIGGIDTLLPFLLDMVQVDSVKKGEYDNRWLEAWCSTRATGAARR